MGPVRLGSSNPLEKWEVMKSSTRVLACLASAAVMVSPTAANPSAVHAEEREAAAPTVLARHLVGPLSLAVNQEGVAFVSQNFGGPIVRIEPGHRTREVVPASAAELGGVSRRGRTTTFVVTGESTPEVAVSSLKTVVRGEVRRVAKLGTAETNRNPDSHVEYGFTELAQECADQIDPDTFGPPTHTGVIESHPYGTAKIGATTYVADAAANVIWAVNPDAAKRIRVLSLLPAIPAVVTEELAGQFGLPDCTIGETFLAEPVPTDVEVGPDGMLYVSTLAGEVPGAGEVYRIDPADGTATPVVDGLSSATGLAVAPGGDIYVAQLFANVIVRFPSGGGDPEQFATVNQPAAVEYRNGFLYGTYNVLSGPSGKLARWAL